jgi:hypothetical protein
MRALLIATLLVVTLAGCTQPTQPIAAQALQLAMKNDDAHVLDLARIAKQGILERGVLATKAATRPADEVLTTTTNDLEQVSWLQLQHERNRSLCLLVKLYIDSQKGVLDIWWGEAKESVAEVTANPAAK